MRYSSYAIAVDFSKEPQMRIYIEWECEDGFDGTTLIVSAKQVRRLLDGEIDNIQGT